MKQRKFWLSVAVMLVVFVVGVAPVSAGTYKDVGAGDTQRTYDFVVPCCGSASETPLYRADNAAWALHSEVVGGSYYMDAFLESSSGINVTDKYRIGDNTDTGVEYHDYVGYSVKLNIENDVSTYVSVAARGHWAE